LISETEEVDCGRGGSGAGFAGSALELESSCDVSGLIFWFTRGGSYIEGPAPKCRASTDPPSSMGVKILRDLDKNFGWGGDWLSGLRPPDVLSERSGISGMLRFWVSGPNDGGIDPRPWSAM
jgi:hypothetical protein